jgi:hypothetical protein
MKTSDISRFRIFQRWVRGSSISFALAMGAALLVPWAAVAQDTPPSGEVQFRQSSIEPGYNDLNGKITYFLTPDKAPEKANGHAVAPLYIIMYPTSAAGSVGTMNCQHQPEDNCPSHGPALAGLAELEEPGVYGDHILAAPPSPPRSGGDFNIAWLPVIVLFTNTTAANTHVTTLDQLNTELADQNVEEIPLPSSTFQCSIVPPVTYQLGTPVPTAPPTP